MPAANRLILVPAALALLAPLQNALSATTTNQFDGSWNAVLITRSGHASAAVRPRDKFSMVRSFLPAEE
jgi:hypothetical protein